tara:strand:+ start:144 stop:518 length:375 start_codon:yes stop_codon:yes gene_type:complete
MKQLLTSIFLLIAVSGCSTLGVIQDLIPAKPVEVNTISLPAPMYHPPLPMEIQAVGVEWKVLTPEIMEEYLKLVQEGKAPAVAYYALTTPQYENLSMNMAEIKRYTKNILSIVEYYREYDKEEK